MTKHLPLKESWSNSPYFVLLTGPVSFVKYQLNYCERGFYYLLEDTDSMAFFLSLIIIIIFYRSECLLHCYSCSEHLSLLYTPPHTRNTHTKYTYPTSHIYIPHPHTPHLYTHTSYMYITCIYHTYHTPYHTTPDSTTHITNIQTQF